MSTRQRAFFAGIAVVIAAVAVIVIAASGGGESDSSTSAGGDSSPAASATATAAPGEAPAKAAKPKPRPIVIAVKGGAVAGGLQKITAKQGDRVRFTVTSDHADQVHLHGYDIEKDVPAGGSVKFDFSAKITGIFEVEMHESGLQIAQVRVNP